MNEAEPAARKASIVVIDDTAANLRLLAGMLTKNGYKVRPMPNGEMGLKTIRTAPPDLVLLDINMPGLSGSEVLALMRAEEQFQHLPVMLMSSTRRIA